MKLTIKPIYLLIGFLLALTSCSNGEEPTPDVRQERSEIRFTPSLLAVTSRGEIMGEDNLPSFNVAAFDTYDKSLLFEKGEVLVTGSKAPYTSPMCLWPEKGKEAHKICFFGYYPALKEDDGSQFINNTTSSTIEYTLSGFKVDSDIARQADFVTAVASGSMEENQFTGIVLPFEHQLSRVEVKAWSANKNCDIEIAGVRIGGVYLKGDFIFRRTILDNYHFWTPNSFSDFGVVEYIFSEGDEIVSLLKGALATSTEEGAASLMGRSVSAMLLPAEYAAGWDYAGDPNNEFNGMYLSVLMRVMDASHTSGTYPENPQLYPYTDLSHGAEALDIPKIYLAVDKTTNVVSHRVYKAGDTYFEDENCVIPYVSKPDEVVKEFGWAALPVKGNWKSGKIYTYTLNYTHGVGVHDPEVTAQAPKAGTAIISDNVKFDLSVDDWEHKGESFEKVPGS